MHNFITCWKLSERCALSLAGCKMDYYYNRVKYCDMIKLIF